MRPLILWAALVFLSFAGTLFAAAWFDRNLLDAVYLTGWVLVAVMAAQLLLRMKKLMPDWLPGSQLAWTRRHVALGAFAILAFAHHCSYTWPDTSLEWLLFGLFATVTASGVIGLYLQTSIPVRLDRNPHRMPAEEIPAERERMAELARQLALAAYERTGSRSLVDIYAERLHAFFERPHDAFAHLQGSQRPLKRLAFAIDQGEPHGHGEEHTRLKELVASKYALDEKHAHEMLMRAWLFVHLPATYMLIAVTLAHIWIVYAFTSGPPKLTPAPQVHSVAPQTQQQPAPAAASWAAEVSRP